MVRLYHRKEYLETAHFASTGTSPPDPHGGHVYPYLIRKTERKPIRVYLLGGSNDLDNPFGHWPLANQMMAASLQFMGYDHRFDFGQCFHGSRGMSASLPDALRWLWREGN